MTYIHLPRGHEIYKFGRPFLVIIIIHLVCMNYAPGLRWRFSKNYINFTLFTQITSPLDKRMQFSFLYPYPTDAKYQMWSRLAQ